MRRAIFALLLVGCAADNPSPEPPVTAPTVAEPQRPAPPVQEKTSKTESSCRIIRTIWGGNCRLDQYLCDDGTYRLDSKCYPPDWAPPWENLPDPPPDYKQQ